MDDNGRWTTDAARAALPPERRCGGVSFRVFEHDVHSFTRDPGWSRITAEADTEAALAAFIAQAETRFWQVWMKGRYQASADLPASPAAVLYEPKGARRPWDDRPR